MVLNCAQVVQEDTVVCDKEELVQTAVVNGGDDEDIAIQDKDKPSECYRRDLL